MKGNISIVFNPNPDGTISSYIPEIPGAEAEGETSDEARANVLLVLKELMDLRADVPHSGATRQETYSFEIFIGESAQRK